MTSSSFPVLPSSDTLIDDARAVSSWTNTLDRALASWFSAVFPSSDLPADEAQVLTWVEAARQGDSAASNSLYRRYVAQVFRMLRPMCLSEAEAEDAVQDTFVQALLNLQSYHPTPGLRFQSWLFAIARNNARKRMRWHRRVVLTDIEPESSGSPDLGADNRLELERNKHALLTALGELPEREREIIGLRYGGELSWSEVAQIVELSDANVRKICERVRGKLVARVQELLAQVRNAGRNGEE